MFVPPPREHTRRSPSARPARPAERGAARLPLGLDTRRRTGATRAERLGASGGGEGWHKGLQTLRGVARSRDTPLWHARRPRDHARRRGQRGVLPIVLMRVFCQHGSPWAVQDGAWQCSFLRSRSATIAGGTAEIQLNIIGKRVLGLAKG